MGQAATFTVSAYPTRPFLARMTRVGFGSSITNNVDTYLTCLEVNNTDLSLRPGITYGLLVPIVTETTATRFPSSSVTTPQTGLPSCSSDNHFSATPLRSHLHSASPGLVATVALSD
jgi:HlyD family secretion protein